MSSSTETPLFFPASDESLFGVVHVPERPAAVAPWVFCHPFGEEKLWSHRAMVSFARRLAARGHHVFRFDYYGNGDSSGEFEESSLTTARRDLETAIAWIRDRTGSASVSLLGLRLGATIAAVAAESLPVDRLVLWAPILDGGRYVQEMLRANLATQLAVHKEIRQDREQLVAHMKSGGSVSVDGYLMSQWMFEDLSATRLTAEPKHHAGPCLVLQVDRPQAPAAPALEALAASYPQGTFGLVREEQFWKEIAQFYQVATNLTDETLRWLDTRPGTAREDSPSS